MSPKVFMTESQLTMVFGCFVTTITVRRREPDGKNRKYSGFWSRPLPVSPIAELVQICRLRFSHSNSE